MATPKCFRGCHFCSLEKIAVILKEQVSYMSIAVIFGGKSCEHDISIITGVLTLNVLIGAGYAAVPVYIDGAGVWYTGPNMNSVAVFGDTDNKVRKKWRRVTVLSGSDGLYSLKGKRLTTVNAAVLCTHGVSGEDGCLQGLLELAGIPYTGSGVYASAAGMNKATAKKLFEAAGLPVAPYVIATSRELADGGDKLEEAVQKLGLPIIVKPANLGSSIGISIANDTISLATAVQVASKYDNTLVLERAFVDFTEFNCAVLGRGNDTITSGVEQPVGWKEFLSFDNKYLDTVESGETVRTPAQIDDELKAKVKALSKAAFECIGASGVARVDLILDKGELYINEINTIPGSLSYYLFEYEGILHSELLTRLIKIAKEEAKDKRGLSYSYKSTVLRSGGSKCRK